MKQSITYYLLYDGEYGLFQHGAVKRWNMRYYRRQRSMSILRLHELSFLGQDSDDEQIYHLLAVVVR